MQLVKVLLPHSQPVQVVRLMSTVLQGVLALPVELVELVLLGMQHVVRKLAFSASQNECMSVPLA